VCPPWHDWLVSNRKNKRPRDPNKAAEAITEPITNEPQPKEIQAAEPSALVNLSEYMAAIGRKGGQIGGKQRLKTMTKKARQKFAARAARVRWGKRKS